MNIGSPCSWCQSPEGEISCAMAGWSPRGETRGWHTPKFCQWGSQRWGTCLQRQDVLFQFWLCKKKHIDHTSITHGKWSLIQLWSWTGGFWHKCGFFSNSFPRNNYSKDILFWCCNPLVGILRSCLLQGTGKVRDIISIAMIWQDVTAIWMEPHLDLLRAAVVVNGGALNNAAISPCLKCTKGTLLSFLL